MRLFLLIGLVAAASLSYAADLHDYISPSNGTVGVALMGGDSPKTYTVSCANGATATQLRPAITDRTRRKVCFENTGNITVALGSSTITASDFYVLGESTNSATAPIYCTNGSGAYYCAAKLGSSAMTVVVLEETQSIP